MYQEAGRIGASLAELAASPLADGRTELVLVDDGSTDDTARVAATALAAHGLRGRVVRLDHNVGKGGAVSAGMAAAAGRAVAFVDADLSAPAEAVARAFEVVESGVADVVVSTRIHEVDPPLLRRWSSTAFNRLLHRLGLTDHPDTQGGLKAFTAEAASILFRDLRIQRFAFDVEVLLRAELAELRIVELPIAWHHVEEASRVRPLRDGARMAVDVLRLRRRLQAWRQGDAPVMARLERGHWWFRAQRDIALDELARAGGATGPALDVGCGTGALLEELAAAGLGPTAGTDASSAALRVAGPGALGTRAEPDRLPFADATFGVVTALDVVEYLDDDVAALAEYHRVTKPGGLVLVATPAGRWAWSAYDVSLGHRRRYDGPDLAAVVRAAGLDVERVVRHHAWLVPLTWALGRTPLRSLLRPPERATFASPRANAVLGGLATAERRLRQRVALPTGLAVLVVARRPAG